MYRFVAREFKPLERHTNASSYGKSGCDKRGTDGGDTNRKKLVKLYVSIGFTRLYVTVSGMFALEKSEGFKILADAFAEHYKEEGWLPEFMNEILAEELAKKLAGKDAVLAKKLAEKNAVLAEKDAKIQDMQNTLIEQAKEMLKDGFPVDAVIKYNKLPRETIESLADLSESNS